MNISIDRIGAEAQPLCILDDFAPDPDALRASAMAATFEPGRHHYPGIRTPLPPGYMRDQMPLIAEAAGRAFGGSGKITLIDASFSIVTTPPAALTLAQRLPHCDAFAPNRIALVHYLSPEGGDGTAFFRHRSTGFETVSEVQRPIYFGQLEAELRLSGLPPPAYISGDTRLFARVAQAEARYNRALLYRSCNLHSGAITPEATLSSDPAAGRLTVTAFFSID